MGSTNRNTTQDAVRAQFEAWAKREDYDITRYEECPDRYLNKHTRDAWEAWQAAIAASGKQHVGGAQGAFRTAELILSRHMRQVAEARNVPQLKIDADGIESGEGGDFWTDAATSAVREALAARQPGAQVPVSAKAVRQFIADRAPNDEHREDVLSGDYNHTDWCAHVAAALSQREKS